MSVPPSHATWEVGGGGIEPPKTGIQEKGSIDSKL